MLNIANISQHISESVRDRGLSAWEQKTKRKRTGGLTPEKSHAVAVQT